MGCPINAVVPPLAGYRGCGPKEYVEGTGCEVHGPPEMDEPLHTDYPHEPGRLHGCPACEARCHCTGDPGHTECVFEGDHRP